MRFLFPRVIALLLASVLVFSPFWASAAFAQALSPAARAAAINGVAASAGMMSVTAQTTAPAEVDEPEIDEPEVDEPEIDEPEVDEPEVDEPEIDEPEVDEPEIDEPEVDEPEVTQPEVADFDLVDHESEGITLSAPAEWDVVAAPLFGNLFTMEAPGTDFVGLVQGGDALDFPGVMAVIVMQAFPDFLVSQFGEGAVLVGVETLFTPQDLPLVKIEFEADLEGEEAAGAFYAVSPGATAYIIIALAPIDEWGDLRLAADVMASSIRFDDSLIDLMLAVDEPIYVTDLDEIVEIVVPEGWQATPSGDPTLPILVVSPGFEYVAALMANREMADEVQLLLDEVLAGDEVDQELLTMVMELMESSMALDVDEMNLNPDLSEVFVVRDELVLRLGGAIDVGDGLLLEVAFYVGLRRDGLSALIVFGDVEQALADEEVLIDILDSLLFIR